MSRLQHKRGRKSNYAHSLKNNEYWSKVRKRIIARDRTCRNIINGKYCNSQLYLEVHHEKYIVNGVNILGKELEYLEYLVLYCSKCHSKEHAK